MANTDSTKINVDSVKSALSSLDTAISSFDGARVIAKNVGFLTTLQDAGLEQGFINSYDTNNQNLIGALSNTKTALVETITNMEGLDQQTQDEIEALLPKKGSGGGGGGGGSSPTTEQLIDNSKEQLEQYKNMSMTDLANVAAELVKIANANNTTLDKILSGEEYAAKITSALLASPNLSKELKELIEIGDPTISQKLLGNIFAGKNPEIVGLDNSMKTVIKSYLKMVSSSNNLSLQDLVMNSNNSALLKESLGNFKNIPPYLKTLTKENMSSSLLDVYDGNKIGEMGSAEVSIIRSVIDASAEAHNSTAETLLTNGTNLASEVSNLGKASVFMNNLTNFSKDVTSSILSTLIGNE